MNILVGTPCYGCQMTIDYFNSMTHLLRDGLQHGVNVDFMQIGNQVTKKARNSIVSYFHTHPEYTHLLFVDADTGVEAGGIGKLLKSGKDVIGAPVALKGFNPDGSPVLNIGKIYSQEGSIAEIEHIGNACLMFSRKAIDALIEISTPYDDFPKYSRGDESQGKAWDVFYVGVMEDGIYRPEDFSTCWKFRNKLGIKVYCDLSVKTTHQGTHQFKSWQ